MKKDAMERNLLNFNINLKFASDLLTTTKPANIEVLGIIPKQTMKNDALKNERSGSFSPNSLNRAEWMIFFLNRMLFKRLRERSCWVEA